jgi:hypothetical protein
VGGNPLISGETMGGKAKARAEEQKPLELVVSREDATTKIQDRIEKGRDLLNRQLHSWEDLEAAKTDYFRWTDYNAELLKPLFTNESLSSEYAAFYGAIAGTRNRLEIEVKGFRDEVNHKIHRLESIKDRLELISLAKGVPAETAQPQPRALGNKAFVVRGHDEAARESVARFLERLGITTVILHEQANAGRTIIEKLEHSSTVDFATLLAHPHCCTRW